MDTEILFVHKLERKKKRKKKHYTEDESEDAKKNKTVHSYILNMDLMMLIQNGAIDRLPTPSFTGGEWTKSKLLSLSYFLKEGSVLQTEWYIEDCLPDSSLYDPEGYIYWKVLSALNALT